MLGEFHLNWKNALDTYKKTELFQSLGMDQIMILNQGKGFSLRSAFRCISSFEDHSLKVFWVFFNIFIGV